MPKPLPRPNAGQLRVWLKLAMSSGVLDRVPAHYAPSGAGGSVDTIDYARDLLAELRDPDVSPRTLDEIAANALRFRQWVESRQKASRRIILAETRRAERFESGSFPPTRPNREPRREPEMPAPRPISPRSVPMWDDFLDGLGR